MAKINFTHIKVCALTHFVILRMGFMELVGVKILLLFISCKAALKF